MVSEKRWSWGIVAILTLSLFLMNGCGEKGSDEKNSENITKQVSKEGAAPGNMDIGLPMYPGAKVNPAFPPINAPHLKNIHIFTSDPLDKVVTWYSGKLGKFDIDRQKKGTQAMWHKEAADGFFMTVTISNIDAPAGQVEITMNKMKTEK
jgi:hypothetical protein